MVRQFFVGGNWKSNGTIASVTELAQGLCSLQVPSNITAVVTPTLLHLSLVAQILRSSSILVGAQNCSATGYGAFTGEVSADSLADMHLNWVILGHSERRTLFGESDKLVAEKVMAAQSKGLSVILCIGETLEQRNADETMQVLAKQLEAVVCLSPDWKRIVVAYEPIWAIGTGVTASPEQAQETHASIRGWFRDQHHQVNAEELQIIYGGSVKPENCVDLASLPDVDGFLVGGASLSAESFGAICSAQENQQ